MLEGLEFRVVLLAVEDCCVVDIEEEEQGVAGEQAVDARDGMKA